MTATVAFFLIFASMVLQIVFLFLRGKVHDRVSHYMLITAALLLFLFTAIRSIQIAFFAITITFESLIFFSGVIALILFVYKLKAKDEVLPLVYFGGTVLSIILLAVASSPNIPKVALPPIPALRSHWLVLHITFAFIGEAFFAFAFAASIYQIAARDERKKEIADRIT
jgi:ABC-type transport system involved in cytochrome c biogenesis permease subunit